MTDELAKQTRKMLNGFKDLSAAEQKTKARFLRRLDEGSLYRDENRDSHFCAWALPYDSLTGKFFLIDHKKSGLWLAPGGHLDPGESFQEAASRETGEELNIFGAKFGAPFWFSVVDITTPGHPCKTHFEMWFLLTELEGIKANEEEFLGSGWFSLEEVRQHPRSHPVVVQGIENAITSFGLKTA